MSKFVEMFTKDNYDNVNQWYRRFQKEVIPYVVVKKRAKLADVSWDYISLPASFDPILREKSDQFTDGLLVLFERFAGKKSRYAVNSFIADFKDIPIDSADELANHLYDYIAKELGLD